MKNFWVGLVTAGVLFVPTLSQSQGTRDNLTIGLAQSPPSLHPGIEPTTVRNQVLRIGYRPITGYDPDFKQHCFLCTEVPTVANGRAKVVELGGGKQGVTVRFTLLPDAKWGDGTPITSKDVAFTWAVGSKPESGFGFPSIFQRISRVEVIDAKNFILHLNTIAYDFANLNDFALLPAHLEEPVVKSLPSPAEYNKRTTYNREPTTPGLWNGPYKLTQIQSGSFFVFEPNPHWWGAKPAFKRITFKVIENTSTLEANLRSGDIDFTTWLSIDQALAMAKEPAMQQKYTFDYPLTLGYERVDLNLNNPLLKDKRVRHALLLAIDRDTIVKQLFENKYPVAHSWVTPVDAGYDPGIAKTVFDPAKAKALLDAAGFKPGAGGVRVNAQNQRLSFEFVTTAGNKLRELVQQVLQNQWKQVGIEVVIKNVPARTFFGETVKKRQYTGLAMSAWNALHEQPPLNTLASVGIPTAANNFSGANYSGFSNAAFDKLTNQLEAELDPGKRRPLWIELQKIYVDETPRLPLYFTTDRIIAPKWLTGVIRPGRPPNNASFIETWGVR